MFRFIINCERSPGVLSKMVVTIRRLGKEILKQKIDDQDDTRSVELDLDGTEPEIRALHKKLGAMPGVFSVKVYRLKSRETEAAPPSHGFDADFVSIRIDTAFPEIAEILLDIREQLTPDTLTENLFQIGVNVAAKRADSELFTIADSNDDLPEIIRTTLLPELALLGKVEYVEEGYETGLMMMSSIFTKPKSGERSSSIGNTFGSLESNAIRCDFLSGYIAGVVNAVVATSGKSYNVSETRCRNEGHPYCLFEFD